MSPLTANNFQKGNIENRDLKSKVGGFKDRDLPSFLPYVFLHPSHLQLTEQPTPPFKKNKKMFVNEVKREIGGMHDIRAGRKPDSIHNISLGSLISCNYILFCVVLRLEFC